MIESTTPTLAFGYNPGLAGATCAWGARWIINQQGLVDQVPDRTDMIGSPEEKQELLAWLNSRVKRQPERVLTDLLQHYRLGTRENREVVLYEDELGIVLGNPNASAGYFYVVARLKGEK